MARTRLEKLLAPHQGEFDSRFGRLFTDILRSRLGLARLKAIPGALGGPVEGSGGAGIRGVDVARIGRGLGARAGGEAILHQAAKQQTQDIYDRELAAFSAARERQRDAVSQTLGAAFGAGFKGAGMLAGEALGHMRRKELEAKKQEDLDNSIEEILKRELEKLKAEKGAS